MTDRLLPDPACLEGKTQENQENCDDLLKMRLQEGSSATEAANSCCSSVVNSKRRNNMKTAVFALVLLTLGQVSCQENLFQCPRGEFFVFHSCYVTAVMKVTDVITVTDVV